MRPRSRMTCGTPALLRCSLMAIPAWPPPTTTTSTSSVLMISFCGPGPRHLISGIGQLPRPRHQGSYARRRGGDARGGRVDSPSHDRGGERDPVVLGPRRPQRCPRTAEYVASPLTEDPGRLRLDVPGAVQVHLPAAFVRAVGEHPAVHDRVGPGLVRRAALAGPVGW